MTIEDKMIVLSEILDVEGMLKVSGIHESNHMPHQFTVSQKHLDYANSKSDGVLTEDILEKYKCAVGTCKLKYSEHTADSQLVLQLKRDAKETDVHSELKKLKH